MGNINFTGILSNIAVIPAVSLLMVVSLISFLISFPVPGAGMFLGRVTDGIYTLILKFIHMISHLNGHFNAGPEMAIPLLICVVLILFTYPMVKKKNLLALPLIFCIAVVWYTLSRENSQSMRKFTLFERHGKSSLLVNDEGSRFLVGKIPDIRTAKAIVNKIEDQNMEGICLVINDPGFNNARSYVYIMKRVKVSRCIISPRFEFTEPVKQLFRLAEKNNIRTDLADIGSDIRLLGEYKTGVDETGYVRALAVFSSLTSADTLKKNDEPFQKEVLVINLDKQKDNVPH
jgi:hypothetical protein